MAHIIVKRHGHTEDLDDRKMYASVYSAALIAHYDEHAAEKLANKCL